MKRILRELEDAIYDMASRPSLASVQVEEHADMARVRLAVFSGDRGYADEVYISRQVAIGVVEFDRASRASVKKMVRVKLDEMEAKLRGCEA